MLHGALCFFAPLCATSATVFVNSLLSFKKCRNFSLTSVSTHPVGLINEYEPEKGLTFPSSAVALDDDGAASAAAVLRVAVDCRVLVVLRSLFIPGVVAAAAARRGRGAGGARRRPPTTHGRAPTTRAHAVERRRRDDRAERQGAPAEGGADAACRGVAGRSGAEPVGAFGGLRVPAPREVGHASRLSVRRLGHSLLAHGRLCFEHGMSLRKA